MKKILKKIKSRGIHFLLLIFAFFVFAGQVYSGVSVINTVDSTSGVGAGSSVAIDTTTTPNTVHISYYDRTNNYLKYAKWTGSEWNKSTVDTSAWSAAEDETSSIALDNLGNPHIAYQHHGTNALKYAKWTGSSWEIQTVDSSGDVGNWVSIALDSNNYSHISYYDVTNSDLKYAKWTGSDWSIQTVASAGNVGACTSIALDSYNNPHISYSDSSNADLKYAKWNGSVWVTQTVDSVGGSYSSMALDSNNYPHISYSVGDDLKYTKWTGSAWSIETIDTSYAGHIYTSIALDTNNYPHISYISNYNQKSLRYIKWTGSSWSGQILYTCVAFEYLSFDSIALDKNNYPHISHNINNVLKLAGFTDVPTLSWTGETGYENDGLNPETGDTSTKFVFKVKYADINGDPPKSGYPKLTIYKGGWQRWGDPVSMTYENGPPADGAIYKYETNISAGTNFTYEFSAYDVWGSSASGDAPTLPVDAPDVTQLVGDRWSIETVDPASGGGTVDYHSSLSLDSFGNPYISYYDWTDSNKNLKSAKWTGSSWQIQIVDPSANMGRYNSIAIDKNNNPHIAYYDNANYDLKYAKWDGSNWNIDILDTANDVGQGASIVVDSNNYPHISYCDRTDYKLKYAKWTGSGWQVEIVDSPGYIGDDTSIALDSNGNPNISYYGNYRLKYAKWTGSSWQIETVDSSVNTGLYSSIAIDTNNKPHVSYYDITNTELKYAKWTGTSWSMEIVDSSGTVGWDSSIDVKGNAPFISYVDDTNSAIKYAKWNGTSWDISTTVWMGYTPRSNALKIDASGISHIAYWASWPLNDLMYTKFSNNVSTLSWTEELGYETDGLDPETGTSTTTLTYRVKYTDADNDAPTNGYPKVHIKKGGVEISGSPFSMNYVSGAFNTGAIYSYSINLIPGTDYTYYYESYDEWGGISLGSPTNSVDAPDVIEPPDNTSPGQITTLIVQTGINEGDVNLKWTAVGDDGYSGTATQYLVKYSTRTFTEEEFDSAGFVYDIAVTLGQNPQTPAIAGTIESKTILGLAPGVTYYFGIKVADEVPNWSVLSNIEMNRAQMPLNTYHNINATDGNLYGWSSSELMDLRNGNSFYFTWSSTAVYIAYAGPDGDMSAADFVVLFDIHSNWDMQIGSRAAPSGPEMDGIESHELPFYADYVLVVEGGGGNYAAVQSWNGASWSDPGDGFGIAQEHIGWSSNRVSEVAILRETLGNPSSLRVMMFHKYETQKNIYTSFPIENPSPNTDSPTYFSHFYDIPSLDSGIIPKLSPHISTTTVAQTIIPNVPLGLSAINRTATTIGWGWVDNSYNEDGFIVRNSTNGIVKELAADTTYWLEIGLGVNTLHYRNVEVYNQAGSSASAGLTVWTLANQTENQWFVVRSSWFVEMAWEANGNPGGTRYGLIRSTDGFGTSTETLKGYGDVWVNTTYTDSAGIKPAATYYYKLCAYNGEGIAMAFGFAMTTVTLPAPEIPPVQPEIYAISGYIKDNSSNALVGVTIDLAGYGTGSLKTDTSGYYSFIVTTNNYVITPSSSNWSFSPPNRNYAIVLSTQTEQNFFGTYTYIPSVPADTLTISGYVKDHSSSVLVGVTVALTGYGTGSVKTDSNGQYSFIVTTNNYVVTPSSINWNFTPASRSYATVSSTQTEQDFYGSYTPPVVANSSPTLTWTGEAGYTGDGVSPDTGASTDTYIFRVKYTDANGDAPASGYPKVHILKGGGEITNSPFALSEVSGGYSSGMIYTFAKSDLVVGTDYTYYFEAQDSDGATAVGISTGVKTGPVVSPPPTAEPVETYTISGYVKDHSSGVLVGVTVALTGYWTGSAQTDSNGQYSFIVTTNNYVVTPSSTNWSFSPSNRNYTTVLSTQTEQNFFGTYISLAGLDTYTTSGYVNDHSSRALSGVTVALSGYLTDSKKTDITGYYEFLVTTNNYVVTPSSTDWSFSPANRNYTTVSSTQTEQNFFGTYVTPPVVNSSPTLAWTGEAGYTADGLEPEVGASTTTFTYRVKYTDIDNDGPNAGYPKVHILKGGNEISGSPFTMGSVSESYSTGVIYTYDKVNLSTGTDYTYYFEAQDSSGAVASGSPVPQRSGPVVSAPVVVVSPVLSVSPTALDFGEIIIGQSKNMTFAITDGNLSNNLSGALSVDKSWISLSQTTFSGNFNTILATVNTAEMPRGQFTGAITVTSNGGNSTVTIQVSPTCIITGPNPFRPGNGRKLIFRGNGVPDGTIWVYSLSGELIRELRETEGKYALEWDGVLDNGSLIVSGIYFYTATNPKEPTGNRGYFTVRK